MPLGVAMGLLLQCQSQGVPVGPRTAFPGSFYADPPVRAVNKKEKLREPTATCVISWDDTEGSCLDDWGVKCIESRSGHLLVLGPQEMPLESETLPGPTAPALGCSGACLEQAAMMQKSLMEASAGFRDSLRNEPIPRGGSGRCGNQGAACGRVTSR